MAYLIEYLTVKLLGIFDRILLGLALNNREGINVRLTDGGIEGTDDEIPESNKLGSADVYLAEYMMENYSEYLMDIGSGWHCIFLKK